MFDPLVLVGGLYLAAAAAGLVTVEAVRKVHFKLGREVIINFVLGVGHVSIGVLVGG